MTVSSPIYFIKILYLIKILYHVTSVNERNMSKYELFRIIQQYEVNDRVRGILQFILYRIFHN